MGRHPLPPHTSIGSRLVTHTNLPLPLPPARGFGHGLVASWRRVSADTYVWCAWRGQDGLDRGCKVCGETEGIQYPPPPQHTGPDRQQVCTV